MSVHPFFSGTKRGEMAPMSAISPTSPKSEDTFCQEVANSIQGDHIQAKFSMGQRPSAFFDPSLVG